MSISGIGRAVQINTLQERGTRIQIPIDHVEKHSRSRSVSRAGGGSTTEWYTVYKPVTHWRDLRNGMVYTFQTESRHQPYAGEMATIWFDPADPRKYYMKV